MIVAVVFVLMISARVVAVDSTFSSFSFQWGLAREITVSPWALMAIAVLVRWLLPMAIKFSGTTRESSRSGVGLVSLEVVKFRSNLELNLEFSSLRREDRMSLSRDSSAGPSTQLWIHSLMKTAK